MVINSHPLYHLSYSGRDTKRRSHPHLGQANEPDRASLLATANGPTLVPNDRSLALVTGGSTGLGLEVARLLARDGHDLLLVARDRTALEQARDELVREHDAGVEILSLDLARREQRDLLGQELTKLGRPVDILINNAGLGVHGAFAETSLDDELRLIDVNVAALTHIAKLVLPGMVARRRGRIMNVASVASFLPGPLMAVYYASKAYVLSFSLALSEEVDGSGVTVTAFCPGTVITNFQRRAGLDPGGAARVPTLMDAATTARAGYDALMRGAWMIVPGRKNKQMVMLTRFMPRRSLTRMVKRVQEKRRKLSRGPAA
jgi:uncharacterized protein